MDKVYCASCRWLYFGDCMAPQNVTYEDTWKARVVKYIKSPKELNANNDCVWFEKEKTSWWGVYLSNNPKIPSPNL